jgi:WD40 repeat protein
LILGGHEEELMDAAFSPDGARVLTASQDKTARLWSAVDGKLIVTLAGHTEPVWSAVFSPDGKRILTSSLDRTARLWSEHGQLITILVGHEDMIRSAVFSPDGRLILTASDDRTARVWSGEAEQATVLRHTKEVTSVVFSPDGSRILTGADDKTARLWTADGKPLAVLSGHKREIRSLAFSPDSTRILTTSDDSTARLWTADGRPLTILAGHNGSVLKGVFSPDGSRIATASDRVRLWNADGKLLETFADDSSGGIAVFSPDGNSILTRSGAGNVLRLWRLSDGNPLASFAGHTNDIRTAEFSPDGKQVLTASLDDTARLWNTDGEQLALVEGHFTKGRELDRVRSATFSLDGSRILTRANDGTARLWTADFTPLAVIHPMHLDKSVLLSPNGTRILTMTQSNDALNNLSSFSTYEAQLWTDDGGLVANLSGHSEKIESAAFSPDGNRVVTASADNTARVWEVFPTTQALVDRVKEAVPRCLTPQQRQQLYLASAPPSWCKTLHKWPYDDPNTVTGIRPK